MLFRSSPAHSHGSHILVMSQKIRWWILNSLYWTRAVLEHCFGGRQPASLHPHIALLKNSSLYGIRQQPLPSPQPRAIDLCHITIICNRHRTHHRAFSAPEGGNLRTSYLCESRTTVLVSQSKRCSWRRELLLDLLVFLNRLL